ncbi:hypothetical protein AB1N83_010063 [Pleurotus pulmonarius]
MSRAVCPGSASGVQRDVNKQIGAPITSSCLLNSPRLVSASVRGFVRIDLCGTEDANRCRVTTRKAQTRPSCLLSCLLVSRSPIARAIAPARLPVLPDQAIGLKLTAADTYLTQSTILRLVTRCRPALMIHNADRLALPFQLARGQHDASRSGRTDCEDPDDPSKS